MSIPIEAVVHQVELEWQASLRDYVTLAPDSTAWSPMNIFLRANCKPPDRDQEIKTPRTSRTLQCRLTNSTPLMATINANGTATLM